MPGRGTESDSAAVDLRGDPDELVGPEEFARIAGWTSGRTAVTSKLARQRFNRLRREVHPRAVALVGGTPRNAERPEPLGELTGSEAGRLLREVAEYLQALPPDAVMDAAQVACLARRTGRERELVHAALVELARPGYRKENRRGLIPDPDLDEDAGGGKSHPKWRRERVWRFVLSMEHPRPPLSSPRGARYTAAQRDAAREAVRRAAAGESDGVLDAALLARVVGLQTANLEPARTLLAHTLAELRTPQADADGAARPQVDVCTRAEIAAQYGLTGNQVAVLLRVTEARPRVPEPVITASRIHYYRRAEVERHFAAVLS